MALQDKYINPFMDFGFKKLFDSDLKNVVDTSFNEGKAEGKVGIARQMKSEGEPIEKIVRFTGLTAEEIGRL